MDHSESILSAASYKEPECAVIRIDPHQCEVVRSSVFKAFGDCPDEGLGALDVLPVEILSSVCLMLDIDAGFHFSQVSRRARAVVASIPEYRRLGDHALQSLCALLRTDIGHHVAISTLHSALVTQDCQSCGSFAGYIFLPTATRCCFPCIESAKGLSAAPLEKLSSESGLSVDQLKEAIPIFHTLPVLNRTASALRGGRRFLVAEQYCIRILRSIGHPEPTPCYFSQMHLPGFGYQASTALPTFDPKTGEIQTGVSYRLKSAGSNILPPNDELQEPRGTGCGVGCGIGRGAGHGSVGQQVTTFHRGHASGYRADLPSPQGTPRA
ncbi:hypothetical protein G7Z17_g5981 [Cylindrodendrum hubeiense]|uniref:F-box domain-containing protein n=1 Tax=Cylindrodendrum hubeiense TaxID=595255 RepID=A0A9P5L8N0_9HYPO|nr:hypothetical protein G7Z17_g5981 [Cylindrodendrum hubeiense]